MTPSREEIEDDIVIVIEDGSYRKQQDRRRKVVSFGSSTKLDVLLAFLGHSARITFWVAVMVVILSLLSVMRTV